mgnify:CR=1 FL=1
MARQPKAMLVLDGIARDIPGQGIHQWEAPAGSWIQLDWEKAHRVGELQITIKVTRELVTSGHGHTFFCLSLNKKDLAMHQQI